ncbi:MAG: hypothetical protein JXD21_04035 [Candidatus Omnitrophica bacterium]|nr:hypothetical protein [Candidatus Omnitrophota bacterium]
MTIESVPNISGQDIPLKGQKNPEPRTVRTEENRQQEEARETQNQEGRENETAETPVNNRQGNSLGGLIDVRI